MSENYFFIIILNIYFKNLNIFYVKILFSNLFFNFKAYSKLKVKIIYVIIILTLCQ